MNRTDLILTIDEEYLYIKNATDEILNKINDPATLKGIILELISLSESELIEDYIFNNFVNKLSDSELKKIIDDNKQFI